MPNTLAHFGVQGLITRAVFRDADPKLIYAGSIVPDVPWILQRAAQWVGPEMDAFALRVYFDLQASLLGSLVLCGVIAMVTRERWRVFLILSLNAFLHLVLDATETKWANGVQFLAPFSWELTNWGFYWPESAIVYFLTALGLAFVLRHWRAAIDVSPALIRPSAHRLAVMALLASAYLIAPLMFVRASQVPDVHYLKISQTSEVRSGQYAEFDRARIVARPEGVFLSCCKSENVRLQGDAVPDSDRASLRGYFRSADEFQVTESHAHARGFRDGASYLGLFLASFLWISSGRGRRIRAVVGHGSIRRSSNL